MDIVAHGLWTLVANRFRFRSRRDLSLIFFGVLPDMIWTPFTLYSLVIGQGLVYHWTPYNVSHSLIIWFGCSVLATWRWRRSFFYTWPYALHLLIDIPGHTDMPTPILWPVSAWHLNGWFDWLSWPWLVITYLSLALCWWLWKHSSHTKYFLQRTSSSKNKS